MKKLLTLTLLLLAAWVTVQAVPAKPGLRTVKQSDGTSIQVRLTGDEWHHSFMTSDGYAVSRAENGDMYYRTTEGVSTIMAHDAAQRSATEKAFISANAEKMTLQSLFTPVQSARRARNLVARKASQVPQTGSPHVPVILVNYRDKKLISSDPVAAWQSQISNPNDVSVYQYFVDQSFGKYKPQFDILGPVTLANNRSTYGGNDYSGNDKGVGKMVAEACQGLPTSVDWTKYDNDGDGVVDVVIVLYAGDGEASSYASDAENAVWPCQWELASSDYGRNITIDGKTISKFAVFNELNGSDLTKLDGIGTFCHEFSHCLDLPDFYCTNYGNYFGMGSWSLMDFGSYNNDG
ncbi:MAG: M6 family metalloprotease domain-containing protein, partial [Bacteroidales bacterium]|nr:M6 family metalloprotease domain-containing protein [Candidatus Sodaliphilus fimicaballi]